LVLQSTIATRLPLNQLASTPSPRTFSVEGTRRPVKYGNVGRPKPAIVVRLATDRSHESNESEHEGQKSMTCGNRLLDSPASTFSTEPGRSFATSPHRSERRIVCRDMLTLQGLHGVALAEWYALATAAT
jgi:hypothetical protein